MSDLFMLQTLHQIEKDQQACGSFFKQEQEI